MQTQGFFADTRVIVNRTTRPLKVRVDNIEYDLVPGRNTVPAFVVPYAVKQNPLPGSMQPNGTVESMIGVPGISDKDDVDMLPPDAVKPGADLFDRGQKPLIGQHVHEKVSPRASIEGATPPRVLDKVTISSNDVD